MGAPKEGPQDYGIINHKVGSHMQLSAADQHLGQLGSRAGTFY